MIHYSLHVASNFNQPTSSPCLRSVERSDRCFVSSLPPFNPPSLRIAISPPPCLVYHAGLFGYRGGLCCPLVGVLVCASFSYALFVFVGRDAVRSGSVRQRSHPSVVATLFVQHGDKHRRRLLPGVGLVAGFAHN